MVGEGHAYVFNPRQWSSRVEPSYHTLSAGDRYDVRERGKTTGDRARKLRVES